MKRLISFAILALVLPLTASAWTGHGHSHKHRHTHGGHQTPVATSTPPVSPTPTTTPPVVPVPQAGEVTFQAYTTGYSWYDNTPAGSAEISNPVLHQTAGGTGTYSDPITLAVGHSITGGKDTLDIKAGTRFYIPNLKRYFIVEDTCGDGGSPQNGPCHTGFQGHTWLDLYVGKGASKSASDSCMDAITEVHTVIQNPGPGYPVTPGDVAANCTQFGN